MATDILAIVGGITVMMLSTLGLVLVFQGLGKIKF